MQESVGPFMNGSKKGTLAQSRTSPCDDLSSEGAARRKIKS